MEKLYGELIMCIIRTFEVVIRLAEDFVTVPEI